MAAAQLDPDRSAAELVHRGVWTEQQADRARPSWRGAQTPRPAPGYGPRSFYAPDGSVLQTDVKGETHQVVGPQNQDDEKYLSSLHSTRDALDTMMLQDRMFHEMNVRTPTGPKYFAHRMNPLYMWDKRTNPDVGAMSGISAQQVLSMRPDKSGRILQSEIPIFEQEAVNPEAEGPVNDHRELVHSLSRQFIQQKIDFFEGYKRRNGSLRGANDAWSSKSTGIADHLMQQLDRSDPTAQHASAATRKPPHQMSDAELWSVARGAR